LLCEVGVYRRRIPRRTPPGRRKTRTRLETSSSGSRRRGWRRRRSMDGAESQTFLRPWRDETSSSAVLNLNLDLSGTYTSISFFYL